MTLERPLVEPAFNLVESINTPERFAVDDEIWRTENAARDGCVDFAFEFFLDGFATDGSQHVVAFEA